MATRRYIVGPRHIDGPRYIDGRRDAYTIFKAINLIIIGMQYCLGRTLSAGQEPKMQIAIFNDWNNGKKIEDYDFGFPVSFAKATQVPVSSFRTPYTVRYKEHVLPVSYKAHLSINRMKPERDHISIDMVIHVPEDGISTADGDTHRENVYLKFHCYADSLPHLSSKDKCFGDIKLRLPPDLQVILEGLLVASQASGVLRNFRKDYHFANSTDLDVLGELVRLSKAR